MKGVRRVPNPDDFQAATLQRFAFISPPAFAISQLLFVHDPCVVASTFESFLRYIFIYSRRYTDPGAKTCFACSAQLLPCSYYLAFGCSHRRLARCRDLTDSMQESNRLSTSIQIIAIGKLDILAESMLAQHCVCLLDVAHFDENRSYATPCKIHAAQCCQLGSFKIEYH